MQQYWAFSLLYHAFTGQKGWKPAWRGPEPKIACDVVIIGAGRDGLATAYYLAKNYGIRNVALLEKDSMRFRSTVSSRS